jgi:hypothetical protein
MILRLIDATILLALALLVLLFITAQPRETKNLPAWLELEHAVPVGEKAQ